jgi:hypothetical protein
VTARKITTDEMQEATRLGYRLDGGECHITLPQLCAATKRSCADAATRDHSDFRRATTRLTLPKRARGRAAAASSSLDLGQPDEAG